MNRDFFKDFAGGCLHEADTASCNSLYMTNNDLYYIMRKLLGIFASANGQSIISTSYSY